MVYRHDIIKTAAFMQTQCQFAALFLIAKRKFHFVAVFPDRRTGYTIVKRQIRADLFKKFLNLLQFQVALSFIRQGLIRTSTAKFKMRTRRCLCLTIRRFQHFKKLSFFFIFLIFSKTKPDFLSRQCIFYHYRFLFLFNHYSSFIWKL